MQNAADFRRTILHLIDLVCRREFQTQRKFKLRFTFRLRTKCNSNVVTVRICSMLVSLCNMRGNTHRRAPQLRGQPKEFLFRECASQRVHFLRERHSELPRLKVTVRIDSHD